MIGISKYNEHINPKKKELKKLLESQTKSTKSGTEYLLCGCGNPIHKERYHIVSESDTGLKLICPICYYPENLDTVASSDMGMLLFAPDLTQKQVNSLAVMIAYLKQLGDDDSMELVEDVLSILKKRQDLMESIYGEGASDPAIFCQFMYSLSEEEYNKRQNFVEHLKYLPEDNIIKRDVAYYKTNILKNYHPTKWRSLLQNLSKN